VPALRAYDRRSRRPSIAQAETETIEVTLRREDDWVSKWAKAARSFGAEVGKLTIKASDDPEALSIKFSNAARDLASIAYALKEASDKPDWFEVLGGTIDTGTLATDIEGDPE
jgi:hypothetical protein